MAKVERFEDLHVWQEARLLRREVSAAARTGAFARDFEMRNQICGAALSAMAKGSAGEVRSGLYAALDDRHLNQPSFETMHARAVAVAKLCSKLISYLQGRAQHPNSNSNQHQQAAPDNWVI